ncbi:uncharacterized protein LOC101899881 isoform X1 [Musca domestica]|uniref:Uncharacterized protein LOC101899881 isoform X1 n=1 Tax=Musca domestica TaxID=7370 RepID=A0A1I8MET1_MUSDO|nr:uncharacterized protein LOC101899881 isoform X1 [Musca domestica]
MSDILLECSQLQLRTMLDILKSQLPRRIQQHNFIYSYLYHYERINANREQLKSERWNLRFYTHRYGKLENCTLITLNGCGDYIVLCFTLQESQEELRECLAKTNLIEWRAKRMYLICDESIIPLMKEMLPLRLNIDWDCTPFENIMYITKEKIAALQVDEILPQDLYVAPLDAEKHAATINENWTHKYENSLGLVRQSIEFNGGLGLFRRGESQPLCWMLENEFLSPGFLYTMPSERRKGYGELIMKLELKRLLKLHNLDLFTYVIVTNERSLQLHRKLGFEIATRIVWFGKPH